MTADPRLLFRMLALSMAYGFTLGVGYDLLLFARMLFSPTHAGKIWRGLDKGFLTVSDIALCLLGAWGIVVIFFSYRVGSLRGFAVLALPLGFFAYRAILGGLMRAIYTGLAAFLRRLACAMWCRVCRPCVRLVCYVTRIICSPFVRLFEAVKEKRLVRYDAAREQQLRRSAEKGFAEI